MESLNWRQDSDGLHVVVVTPSGKEAVFTIANSFINFLMAGTPRRYLVYVKIDGCSTEEAYMLNLENLKPYINKTNGLKISNAKKTSGAFLKNGVRVGLYCMARGESYSDRFLGDNGWQTQRVYHDICEIPSASGVNTAAEYRAPEPKVDIPPVTPKVETPPAPSQDDDLDLDLTL
jgi:hypothetical protein